MLFIFINKILCLFWFSYLIMLNSLRLIIFISCFIIKYKHRFLFVIHVRSINRRFRAYLCLVSNIVLIIFCDYLLWLCCRNFRLGSIFLGFINIFIYNVRRCYFSLLSLLFLYKLLLLFFKTDNEILIVFKEFFLIYFFHDLVSTILWKRYSFFF